MLEKGDWDGATWKAEVEGLEPCLLWFGAA